MNPKSLIAALLVLSVSLLGTTVYAATPLTPSAPTGGQTTAATTACESVSNPFAVTQSAWGLPGSAISVSPGAQNVPFTVTLLYTGSCTITAASFKLSLAQPFTATNGQGEPTDYEVNVAPDTMVSESYYLDVNSSAALNTYDLPLNIGYNTSSYSGLFFQNIQLSVPLKGSVSLAFSSNTSSLYAGTTDNLTILITNSGSGTATLVTPTVSTAGQVAILNQLASVNDIPPNSTVAQQLRVYVPSSASGSAVSLVLSAAYYDAYSIGRTITQTLGFSVSAAPSSVTLLFSTDSATLTAGAVNNITLAISNTGSAGASSLSFAVAAPSQVAILNQLPSISALGSGRDASEVLQIFVPASMSGSVVSLTITTSYADSLSISRTQTQTLGFYVVSSLPSPPFSLEVVEWGSANLSPQPGDSNVPLTISVQYLGSTAATSLRATLGLPTGFTGQNSGTTAVAYVTTVGADQAVQLTFYLDLAESLASGSYSFPLQLAWTSSSSSNLSENLTVVPPAVGQPSGSSGVALSLAQSDTSIVAGASSTVSFVLKNVGAASVYSPGFSLTISSPIVVMGGLTTGSASVLASGQSAVLSALVSSGPSSTPGVYGGTLTVTYTDLNGNLHTQNFAIGFVLSGSVELVLQDVQVTQTSSSVTVSGSILNEGSAAAYYSSVSGSIGRTSTGNESADYVGEIDPNTPTSFSVTIPYPAPGSTQPRAEIAINISYRNSFGANSTFAGSTTASLESAEQLFLSTATSSGSGQGSSGGRLLTLVSYSIIAVIVVAVVAGALVVRRRRAPSGTRKEDKII